MKSKHFKTEQELLEFANDIIHDERVAPWNIKGIVKDVTNGDWILFYIES